MKFARNKSLIRQDITIQVTGDCNLACTYCYQHSKNKEMVDVDKAKKFLKSIVTNDQNFWNGYMFFNSESISPCIQFIGGEPLVNYKAVIELCDYYYELCQKYNPNLWCRSLFGICTNGTIYNDEIEKLLLRYKNKFSVGVSIDGNKELHDTCRRFKLTNAPSYDIAVKNLEKFRNVLGNNAQVGTKFTVSHENIDKLSEATINLFDTLQFQKVPANCVFEDVWSLEDAKKLYVELKKIADWFLEKQYVVNTMNLYTGNYENREFGFFSEKFFTDEYDFDGTWCGGNGRMAFMQYDGKIYCCNRYSEISMGDPNKDLFIGTTEDGITRNEVIECLHCAKRQTMYDDECKNCPVARGCADCLAYCYEVNGEFKKLKHICDMHKSRSLANVYFWNKYYIQHNIKDKYMFLNLPLSEALKYISEEELEMLLDISNRRYVKDMKQKCC